MDNRKKAKRQRWLLYLLAPFLVDRWHRQGGPWLFAKQWMLWDALDEADRRADDDI